MKNRNRILLVPFDFTEVADVAADHAIGIAKMLDWKVMLLHIFNKDTKSLLNVSKPTLEIVQEKLKERTERFAQEYSFEVDCMVREGSIFEDIAKVSEELGAGFVVMGTHGKQGIQHFIGSYAFKVITSSEVPFIVVQKRKFSNEYKRIVLPLDDSLESRQKIKWAIYIAKSFNATILIKAMYQSDEIQRYKLNIVLQRLLSILDENDISYEYEMKEGNGSFSKQTIQYAKENNADMIVIMTGQDAGSFPAFIFNPADEYILFNEEHIPVMCVNPRELNILM